MREQDPYHGLIRVSCVINSIHDYTQLLTSLLQITREVMKCDAGSLMLYEPATEDLKFLVALGERADKLKEMGRLKMGQGVAGWVAQNRKSALVPDTTTDERFFKGADTKTGFHTRSIICVPLLLEEKLVGVLQALNPIGKKSFDEKDLEIFEAYGALAATAIEKIRWQETMLQQQKNAQELEIAQEIQERFLSDRFEKAEKSFQLAFYTRAAFQVGGDFYDVQETLDGTYAVVLGDVTGKGVPAALLMAQILSEFRYTAPRESDPARILSRMNDSLSTRSARGMFATAWCAIVRPAGGALEVLQASAGHLAPMRCRPSGVDSIELESGFPLGLMHGSEYTPSRLIMQKDEMLCVYTDGITEGRNEHGEEFGNRRLEELLIALSRKPVECKAQLIEALHRFGKGTQQRDDITFLLCSP